MNEVNEDVHNLTFVSRMNIYYHEKKERKFTLISNLVTFTSLISSSVAFATLSNVLPQFVSSISQTQFAAIVTFTVAVLNGLSLAFGIPSRVVLHMGLKKRWNEVLALAEDGTNVNQAKILQSRINGDEPAPDERALKDAYDYAIRVLNLQGSAGKHEALP